MTWWDHDTGSIWSQPLGEAIAGPRKGQTIELLPMSFTTWGAWQDEHPGTLALDVPGAITGFDLDGLDIVVDFGTDSVAYPVAEIQGQGVINDVVAGVELAVLIDPSDPMKWQVLSRHLDDWVLTLDRDGDRLVDIETGTEWDPIRGIGLSGPLAGEILDILPALTSFPDDVDTFWPDAERWRP